METNYTPGPWSVFSTYAQPEVLGADGSLVAVLPVGELKDAYLISAAPGLLDALQDLLIFDNGKPEFDAARAAIAKANGAAA